MLMEGATAYKDGGFSYGGKKSDVDMTAMAVQALAPYSIDNKKAGKAVKKAIKFLSKKQNKDGGYDTCESVAQVILAIGSMRYNPLKERKFIKDSKNGCDRTPHRGQCCLVSHPLRG